MDNEDDLIRILLAEVIDQAGGIIQLDSNKILNNLKDKKFKRIGVSISKGVAFLEVFDEDEDQASD